MVVVVIKRNADSKIQYRRTNPRETLSPHNKAIFARPGSSFLTAKYAIIPKYREDNRH